MCVYTLAESRFSEPSWLNSCSVAPWSPKEQPSKTRVAPSPLATSIGQNLGKVRWFSVLSRKRPLEGQSLGFL